MIFNDPDHVYRCVPPVLGNNKLEKPFVIGLLNVRPNDLQRQVLEQQGLDPAALAKMDKEFIEKHIKFIESPPVGAHAITTWDDVLQYLPTEISQWVKQAIYSRYALSEAERKN